MKVDGHRGCMSSPWTPLVAALVLLAPAVLALAAPDPSQPFVAKGWGVMEGSGLRRACTGPTPIQVSVEPSPTWSRPPLAARATVLLDKACPYTSWLDEVVPCDAPRHHASGWMLDCWAQIGYGDGWSRDLGVAIWSDGRVSVYAVHYDEYAFFLSPFRSYGFTLWGTLTHWNQDGGWQEWGGACDDQIWPSCAPGWLSAGLP